jgi:DNA polymerase III alpha subunit
MRMIAFRICLDEVTAAMGTIFDDLIERCRLALRAKYRRYLYPQAEALLDAEVVLVRSKNFEDALIQMLEYGDRLRQLNANFHVVGSGVSSIILYVMGMSEVDPIKHDTHFQRFWQTWSGDPPILQVVIDSLRTPEHGQISRPTCVSVHPMTPLESMAVHLEAKLGPAKTFQNDQATLTSLQAGDTAGVFQLDSERVKWLLRQVRPTNIEQLARVTALAQICQSEPEVVFDYLVMSEGIFQVRCALGSKAGKEAMHSLPLLFQEQLMSLLRRYGRLEWVDTYPFVQTAAKGKMDEHHPLWISALNGMKESRPPGSEELFRKIVAASRWTVCLAHHIANALTSYKVAHYRTHHRFEFELVQKQISDLVSQNSENDGG